MSDAGGAGDLDGGDLEGGDLDGLLGRIGEWRDDQEAAAAARSRSRRHWLRHQAVESTTLAGVLLTLAEREAPVVVRTAGGDLGGVLTSVTSSLCTLALVSAGGGAGGGGGGHALVPLAAVTAVTALDGVAEILDDRTPVTTTDLATALAELAADRSPVTLGLRDGTAVAGTLDAVGADVVRIGATHVPVGAIVYCVVR